MCLEETRDLELSLRKLLEKDGAPGVTPSLVSSPNHVEPSSIFGKGTENP